MDELVLYHSLVRRLPACLPGNATRNFLINFVKAEHMCISSPSLPYSHCSCCCSRARSREIHLLAREWMRCEESLSRHYRMFLCSSHVAHWKLIEPRFLCVCLCALCTVAVVGVVAVHADRSKVVTFAHRLSLKSRKPFFIHLFIIHAICSQNVSSIIWCLLPLKSVERMR